jgi:hypothetical protein
LLRLRRSIALLGATHWCSRTQLERPGERSLSATARAWTTRARSLNIY